MSAAPPRPQCGPGRSPACRPCLVLAATLLAPAVESVAGGTGPEAGRGADEVLATVNGEPVTRAEFVQELLIRHGKAVLEDMIRERAIEQEMARAKITVSGYEIDTELERQRRAFAARGKKLRDMVTEKYGMSMEGYRAIIRRWLLIRKLIVRRERPTEEEVMVWFFKNRERRYDTPAEITVRHILIARKGPRSGRERSEAEVQRRIAQVREGLVRGEAFDRLARRHSDDAATRGMGGALGTVNENAAILHLERPFVEAMMSLRAGQSGGPVETRKGFHFLKVTARKEGRRAEYEDFRAAARVDYVEDRADMMKDVFLREVMDRAKITRSFVPPKREREKDLRPEELRGLGE